MSVVYKKLEEVCEILDSRRVPITAKDRKAGVYPYYGANGLQDYVADYIFDDELVLLAEDGGNFGSKERPIAYRVSGKCWVNNHAHVLKAKPIVNVDYLCYALMFYDTEGLVNGATRQKLTQSAMRQMVIPYRNMAEQVQIVDEVSRVTRLIDKRKEELLLLDQLVKSRFIELFGDPMTNPMGFPCYTVGDVIDFQGGSQPDKKYFEYEPTPDNIRLIQIRDYKSDKYITYIPRAMAKRFCTADDIMIGRYGPPIFQILKGIEGSFNVALMKATPKMGNREFVRQFLKQDCLLEYLEGLSKRTAGQDGIQMDKLKAYPFPYPPIELQEQFAAFVEQTDKSKYYSAIMYRKSGEPYCQSKKKLICIYKIFSRCSIWFPTTYRTV